MRIPVWPVARKVALAPRARRSRSRVRAGKHLADATIGTDGEEALARTPLARADHELTIGIPHVVQPSSQPLRVPDQLGDRVQSRVQSVRDVEPCGERPAQGLDPVRRQHPARVDDTDDEGPRSRSDGLFGCLPRESDEIHVVGPLRRLRTPDAGA